MSQQKRTAAPEVFFRDMSGRDKLVFIGKATVFFISGGFIYPTIWID